MSDTEEPKDEPPTRELPRHRFTMKSLSQLVDDNRVKTGTLPERYETTGPVQSDDPGEQVESSVATSLDIDEAVVNADAEFDDDDGSASDGPGDVGEVGEVGDDLESPLTSSESEDPDQSGDDPTSSSEFAQGVEPEVASNGPAKPEGPVDVEIELRPLPEPISQNTNPRRPGARKPIRRRADLLQPDVSEELEFTSEFVDDGIDRSSIGESVTRTGLGGLLSGPQSTVGVVDAAPSADISRPSAQPLARHILDDEIAPGGRLSDPRDVPGIVLNLAKDLPAAAAVSVVRIDEEIELVGNSIDPNVDSSVLAGVFSGVFRTLQVASGALADGPLGAVHDMVIEGENMDLVLRPLGVHYYLMVLEDRRSPHANLAGTRMRMAALAPGLSAILANDNGDD